MKQTPTRGRARHQNQKKGTLRSRRSSGPTYDSQRPKFERAHIGSTMPVDLGNRRKRESGCRGKQQRMPDMAHPTTVGCVIVRMRCAKRAFSLRKQKAAQAQEDAYRPEFGHLKHYSDYIYIGAAVRTVRILRFRGSARLKFVGRSHQKLPFRRK
jgi:hypothetical protein